MITFCFQTWSCNIVFTSLIQDLQAVPTLGRQSQATMDQHPLLTLAVTQTTITPINIHLTNICTIHTLFTCSSIVDLLVLISWYQINFIFAIWKKLYHSSKIIWMREIAGGTVRNLRNFHRSKKKKRIYSDKSKSNSAKEVRRDNSIKSKFSISSGEICEKRQSIIKHVSVCQR